MPFVIHAVFIHTCQIHVFLDFCITYTYQLFDATTETTSESVFSVNLASL